MNIEQIEAEFDHLAQMERQAHINEQEEFEPEEKVKKCNNNCKAFGVIHYFYLLYCIKKFVQPFMLIMVIHKS